MKKSQMPDMVAAMRVRRQMRAAQRAASARALPEPPAPQGSLRCDGVVGQKRAKKDDWARGYFCAVAVLLKLNYSEGVSGPDTDELFRTGGDWRQADPEDIETFRRHGLLPNNPVTHDEAKPRSCV